MANELVKVDLSTVAGLDAARQEVFLRHRDGKIDNPTSKEANRNLRGIEYIRYGLKLDFLKLGSRLAKNNEDIRDRVEQGFLQLEQMMKPALPAPKKARS